MNKFKNPITVLLNLYMSLTLTLSLVCYLSIARVVSSALFPFKKGEWHSYFALFMLCFKLRLLLEDVKTSQ